MEFGPGDPAQPSAAPPHASEGRVASLSLLLVLASLATAAVALWLFWATTTVLVSQDPAHIPMWRGIAACFLAYSALSIACVTTGRRSMPLPWMLGIASLAAVGLGVYGLCHMLRRAAAGGDFEGYILLMGAVLAGHGLVGLLNALLIPRARPLLLE